MTKLRQVLNKKEKKELIGIIENFIEKYPELESVIKMDKKEITSRIKGLFSHLWEWNQVKQLIFQLDIILEGINKNRKLWDKNLLQEMEKCADK